ncbi:5'/3'-nucleotidase SurE [Escherichia coli]
MRTFTFENGDIRREWVTPDRLCLSWRECSDAVRALTLFVSGINAWPESGDDVIYSGTVAAAMEGRHLGFPALAVSLDGHKHYDTAAAVTCSILRAR